MASDRKQKITSHLSLVFRIGIAILACWIVFKDIDFVQLGGTFKQLHIFILLASIIIFILTLSIIGFRWWIFMRAQRLEVPLGLAIKLTYLGQFFTNFMPSAVGGDLVRAWYISRHSDKKLQAALSVVVDRVMGLVSTFFLAMGSYLIFMRGQWEIFEIHHEGGGGYEWFDKLQLTWTKVIPLLLVLAGIIFILSDIKKIKLLSKRFMRHLIHFVEQLKDVLKVYYHHPVIIFWGLGTTILGQSIVILSFWMIGSDLGMEAPIRYYFVFFPIVWVIGAIPVSIAGIGILEGGLVFLFVHFTGASVEMATTLALCQRFVWLASSIPGMVVHLTGAHRARARIC